MKDSDFCRKQMLIMNEIGKRHLVRSGKDISNPGCIGTLGMLLETSGKGGRVELNKIPRPQNVDLEQWLLAYQGCGFTVTCDARCSREVIDIFNEVGITAAVVGVVDDTNELVISDSGASAVVFDLKRDKITGCDPSKLPSHAQR